MKKKSVKEMIINYIGLNINHYPYKININNIELIENIQSYISHRYDKKRSQETIGRKFREIREHIKFGHNPYNLEIKVISKNKSNKSITFEIKQKE